MFSRYTPGKMHGVILNSGAVPGFLHHLEVVHRPLTKTGSLDNFALSIEFLDSFIEFLLNGLNADLQSIRCRHIVLGRVDIEFQPIDEEFTRQCLERGRIEDSEVLFNFLRATGEDVVALVRKGWLGTLIRRMNNLPLLGQGRWGAFLARLPVAQGLKMGWALVFKPRTKSWGRTGEVLQAYVAEQKRRAHERAAGAHA